ncbi:hypothetical protein GQ44DRAFT_710841 [Phaeosphaeriaceae sp. PMI808]|nr:hypothetical protein GQ44DRAFT_710841 [Phaeosphaeriaceae sp. PMI808]
MHICAHPSVLLFVHLIGHHICPSPSATQSLSHALLDTTTRSSPKTPLLDYTKTLSHRKL